MPQLELQEDIPSRVTIIAHALMRCVIGALLVMHGVIRLLQLDVPGELWIPHFDGLDVSVLTLVVAGIEVAAGASLALGWFTRLSALVLICRSGIAIATHYQTVGMKGSTGEFELPLVLLCAALLFCAAGPGAISVDAALRARARRKAIEDDSIWLRPPYVSAPEQPPQESSSVG